MSKTRLSHDDELEERKRKLQIIEKAKENLNQLQKENSQDIAEENARILIRLDNAEKANTTLTKRVAQLENIILSHAKRIKRSRVAVRTPPASLPPRSATRKNKIRKSWILLTRSVYRSKKTSIRTMRKAKTKLFKETEGQCTQFGESESDTSSSSDGTPSPKSDPKKAQNLTEPIDPKRKSVRSAPKTSHMRIINDYKRCYIIATCHILFSLPTFSEYVLKKFRLSRKKDVNILNAVNYLARNCLRLEKSNPQSLHRHSHVIFSFAETHCNFAPKEEHDMVEFMSKFLQFVQSSMAKALGKDLFQSATVANAVICPSCRYKIPIKKDTQLVLQVAVTERELSHLIIESLVEKLRLNCCDEQEHVVRKSEFTMLPDILMVQLKRYKSNEKGDIEKIRLPVEIDESLVLTIKSRASGSTSRVSYALKGIVIHVGDSVSKGHYRTYVFDQSENQWLLIDDGKVSVEASLLTVLQSNDVKCNAYLACYLKQ